VEAVEMLFFTFPSAGVKQEAILTKQVSACVLFSEPLSIFQQAQTSHQA